MEKRKEEVSVKLGILTCRDLPLLSPDDETLIMKLMQLKIPFEILIWDQTPAEYFHKFDYTLIRTTWDYHHQHQKFLKFLEELENHTHLINPFEVVKWNMHKKYLLELERRGIKIPESKLLTENNLDLPWEKFVLKPTISATAHLTKVFTDSQITEAQQHLQEILKEGDCLAQKYYSSIELEGEVSLLYFAGQYSHAVLKKAKAGDFRVQADFGGSIEKYKPRESLLEFSDHVVSKIKVPWYYARVDVLLNSGEYLLGELEMIEPQLYIKWASAESLNLFLEKSMLWKNSN